MIVEPKTRGFICTTAHPAGCQKHVQDQISLVKSRPATGGPKRALVIGASTGYGLSSRICAAFTCGAATVGVMYEKPAAGSRTASAGWYNTAAFEKCAAADGLYAKTINGDAFSAAVKEQAAALIKEELGQVDLVVYSLAAPRRTLPDGTVACSVLKTTGAPYTNKTINLKTRQLAEITIEPATPQEIADTVKVMGGEDWMDWMRALQKAGVLADGATSVAYSYIGPALTHPMYYEGSIGAAKKELYATAGAITREFPGVRGYISVNKALVTQSSAAIPVVPLYISALYKVMKARGVHEGCTEQMYRLFHEKLYGPGAPVLDGQGMLRLDDWEMREDIQREVAAAWERLDDKSLEALTDIDGYWLDFYQMFGFQVPGVDYGAQVDIDVPIPSLGGQG